MDSVIWWIGAIAVVLLALFGLAKGIESVGFGVNASETITTEACSMKPSGAPGLYVWKGPPWNRHRYCRPT